MTKYFCDLCGDETVRPREKHDAGFFDNARASFKQPFTVCLRYRGLTLEYVLVKGEVESITGARELVLERADICRKCFLELIENGSDKWVEASK